MTRYVFVAAPNSRGNVSRNVQAAIVAGEQLLAAGFVPFVPHLCHLWDLVSEHDYETWMRYTLAWVERCDALVRLPGESPGADREVARAVELGRPVFRSVNALFAEGVTK